MNRVTQLIDLQLRRSCMSVALYCAMPLPMTSKNVLWLVLILFANTECTVYVWQPPMQLYRSRSLGTGGFSEQVCMLVYII